MTNAVSTTNTDKRKTLKEDEKDLKNVETYRYEEVLEASNIYFGKNENSELPARVFADKYALRNKNNEFLEKTPDDMHWRIAKEIARVEKTKFSGTSITPLSEHEIHSYIKEFEKIIPQGSPMYAIGNPYQYVSAGNCFVANSPDDSYGSIMKIDEEIVQISKRRGGVGVDLDKLRPTNFATQNAARTSTGIPSFMKRYSNSIREVGQEGRRGALLLSLSIHHPDAINLYNKETDGPIEEIELPGDKYSSGYKTTTEYYNPKKLDFVSIKLDRQLVTGANISVKLTDEFMNAVAKGEKYEQRWPVDAKEPKYSKWVDARSVWRKIIHVAWLSGEPGLLLWDNIIRESPADCYADLGFKTVSTNPCITGDTPVYTADGRGNVPIKQLADEGKDVDVFCLDDKNNMVVRKMRNPRITGYDKDIYKVTFDDGSSLRCTGNHKIKTTDNDYKEAKDLEYGDSILTCSEIHKPIVGDAKKRRTKYYRWLKISGKVARTERSLIEARSQGYEAKEIDGHPCVKKICEATGKEFWVNFFNREISFISLAEANKWRANNDIDVEKKRIEKYQEGHRKRSEKIRIKQLKIYTSLKQELDRDPMMKEWEGKCKLNSIPFRVGKKAKYGFKSYSEVKKEGELFNHRVEKVEIVGKENVYSGTVDEFHNYFSCIKESKTKPGKPKSLYINNLNCGELPLCSLDSCRLLVVNLMSCVDDPFTQKSKFNYKRLYEYTQIAQRFMDDFIELELEKIDSIINKIESDPEDYATKCRELDLWIGVREKCEKGRRTGTGITALANAIAACGIGYSSKKGLDMSEKIYATLKLGAYRMSVDLAEAIGPFPIWDKKRETDHPFLNRIAETSVVDGDFSVEGKDIYKDMQKFGRRNIALLTTAPTGSVSICAKNVNTFGTSGGIEPEFAISYTRRKKGNPGDLNFRSDFVDQTGDHWMNFKVFSGGARDWSEITGETNIEKSPWHGHLAPEIDWAKRVELQSRCNRHIDHSISGTVNLPNDAKEEDVAKIYEAAWRQGAKGITVYRDGCRTGVLVADNSKLNSSITKSNAPKRPKDLAARIHHITVKGTQYFVMVGLMNGEPYEIFAGKNGFIDKKVNKAEISRIKRGHYMASLSDGSVVDEITDHITDEEAAITRMISTCLRHGVDIKYCVDQLEKVPGDLNSFAKSISRALKKHIPDNSIVTGFSCPECDHSDIVRSEGCKKCLNCGWTACS